VKVKTKQAIYLRDELRGSQTTH